MGIYLAQYEEPERQFVCETGELPQIRTGTAARGVPKDLRGSLRDESG